jgi:hypothetical protein
MNFSFLRLLKIQFLYQHRFSLVEEAKLSQFDVQKGSMQNGNEYFESY